MAVRDKCRIVIKLFLILLAVPFSADGKDPGADNKHGERSYISYTVNNNSWLSLAGTTNFSTFECLSGSGLSSGYILTEADIDQNTINLTGARILVDVGSFNCKNPLISRDMYNALGGSKYPNIEIKLQDVIQDEGSFGSSAGTITANVIIILNGISRDTELNIGWHSTDGFEYHFKGSKELLMSDFGIDPPSPALGIVRVDDRITVYFNYVVHTGIISRMD